MPLALIAACRPAPRPSESPVAAVASACPLSVFPDQPWAHEVFAGCPEMPFAAERLPVCLTNSCPHACGAITGARVFAIHYDGRGRWIDSQLESSTNAADLLSIACTYDGDRLATCTRRYVNNAEWTDRLERDAAGRLVRVVNDQEQIEIRRDAAGRPIALVDPHGETHFAYDERGRIVREVRGEHVVSDDYTGDRWSARRDDIALTELRYDGDRLASASTRDHGGIIAEVHVTYDVEGRVRTVTRSGETTTYQYDCH